MDINELTYQINGAIFEVNRVLGAGFLEKVYENALLIELIALGDSRPRIRFRLRYNIRVKKSESITQILSLKTKSFWNLRRLIRYRKFMKLSC